MAGRDSNSLHLDDTPLQPLTDEEVSAMLKIMEAHNALDLREMVGI